MKLLRLLVQIKERELKENQKKLIQIRREIEEKEKEKRKTEEKLLQLEHTDVRTIFELSVATSYSLSLLERLRLLSSEILQLENEAEKVSEKLAVIKSEKKLLEKKMKDIKLKKEKREDVLLERFINEVLTSRNLDSA